MTIAQLRRNDPFAPITPSPFNLVSEYQPAGDQPAAIEALCEGLVCRPCSPLMMCRRSL